MEHVLRLQSTPFSKIKAGAKTVEVRLYDEKRQLLKIGDTIEFFLVDDPSQKVRVKILDLVRCTTFVELYNVFSPEELGELKKEDWENMYHYYTKEQEEWYGVLGIKFQMIP